LAAELIDALKGPVKSVHPLDAVELSPAGGGVFDVTLDNNLIFSKHQVGRHAEPGEVLGLVRKHLGV
jgi:selenoprotein W-related protein